MTGLVTLDAGLEVIQEAPAVFSGAERCSRVPLTRRAPREALPSTATVRNRRASALACRPARRPGSRARWPRAARAAAGGAGAARAGPGSGPAGQAGPRPPGSSSHPALGTGRSPDPTEPAGGPRTSGQILAAGTGLDHARTGARQRHSGHATPRSRRPQTYMITWRARTHKPCETTPTTTNQGKSGMPRSPAPIRRRLVLVKPG